MVFGISSMDMRVSTTVRMAANLGFETAIVGDACHTWGQRALDGGSLDADLLHPARTSTTLGS